MFHHALASKCRPVKDFLLSCEGHVGGTSTDDRLFVGAVLYRYHASIPWRNLPVHFGDRKNVHWRLCLWCESAVIETDFAASEDEHESRELPLSLLCPDV